MSNRKPIKWSHIAALAVGVIAVIWIAFSVVAFVTSLIFKAVEAVIVVLIIFALWKIFSSRK
ncbi:MAG: hypothetical protein HKL80_02730 [Acidimicrobiales bacterium]|nr:hypothetical protein [Acidimicrobiales bacterium]